MSKLVSRDQPSDAVDCILGKEDVAFWRFLEILPYFPPNWNLFWGLLSKFYENNTKNDFKLSEHPTFDFRDWSPEVQVSDLAVF